MRLAILGLLFDEIRSQRDEMKALKEVVQGYSFNVNNEVKNCGHRKKLNGLILATKYCLSLILVWKIFSGH